MKQEIISKLNHLLSMEYSKESKAEFENSCNDFYNELEKEKQLHLDKLKNLNEGEEIQLSELEEFNEDLNIQIKDLIKQYITKTAQERQKIEEEYNTNFNLKKALIESFKKVISEEENINKSYLALNEFKEKWEKAEKIAPDKYHDLQSEFRHIMEDFHYNINIYKALKENDLKKNLELKIAIIEKVKKIAQLKELKEIEISLNNIKNEWEEVGPTYREKWEELKDAYWTEVKNIYAILQEGYQLRKEQSKKNIEFKQAVIEKIAEVIADRPTNHTEWENKTRLLLAIQDEWKKIGYIPKEENENLWNKFREHYDVFFDEKKAFYEGLRNKNKEAKEAKELLIEKAEKLKISENWKDTTIQLIQLQKQWKQLGSSGKKHEQKLWEKFRAACDYFFDAKKASFEVEDQKNQGNLDLKNDVIAKVEAYLIKEDINETIEDLKQFSLEFNSIGQVPFKEKDKVFQRFRTAIDMKYDQLSINKEELEELRFESKLNSIHNAKDPERAFYKEKEILLKRIRTIEEDVLTYENNLGFFANSKGAEKMIEDVNRKIDKHKRQLDKYKLRLKLLKNAEKEHLA